MKPGKDFIIFALDVPSIKEAEDYARSLSGRVAMFKVGLELFIKAGPEVVRKVREISGAGVFLDLKLYDIPATVSRAVRSAVDIGASLTTVHCGESEMTLEAAAAAGGGDIGVLGITVLTSVSGKDIAAAGYKEQYSENLQKLVLKRAATAKKAGCAGVVCSGLEVGEIKKRFGRGFLSVTPGIRPVWDNFSADDQKRIVTPASAVKAGADFIVVGRPIRDARDPAEAARKIAEEIDAL